MSPPSSRRPTVTSPGPRKPSATILASSKSATSAIGPKRNSVQDLTSALSTTRCSTVEPCRWISSKLVPTSGSPRRKPARPRRALTPNEYGRVKVDRSSLVLAGAGAASVWSLPRPDEIYVVGRHAQLTLWRSRRGPQVAGGGRQRRLQLVDADGAGGNGDHHSRHADPAVQVADPPLQCEGNQQVRTGGDARGGIDRARHRRHVHNRIFHTVTNSCPVN